jgi:hypothetical protein
VPFEYLSDEQAGRYCRFVADPTPEELEKFFFLDAETLALVRSKRRLHNRLGWSIQWGTVRMLGTFLTDSDPVGVPEVVIRYMAEQLDIAEWLCVKRYPERLQTQYEHAWEIRDLLGYREFTGAEQEVGPTSRPGCTRPVTRGGICSIGRWCGWWTTGCCCPGSRACRGW